MDFLFVGNAVWVDLVNTEVVVGGERIDLLQTDADVGRWLKSAGADPGGSVDEARKLRQVLRTLADALREGRPPSVRALNKILAEYRSSVQLHGTDSGYRIIRQLPGLGQVAESAAQFLAACDWKSLKHCEGDRCILYYLDTSKNQRRRWCSMALCGNRHKVAEHYRRQKAPS